MYMSIFLTFSILIMFDKPFLSLILTWIFAREKNDFTCVILVLLRFLYYATSVIIQVVEKVIFREGIHGGNRRCLRLQQPGCLFALWFLRLKLDRLNDSSGYVFGGTIFSSEVSICLSFQLYAAFLLARCHFLSLIRGRWIHCSLYNASILTVSSGQLWLCLWTFLFLTESVESWWCGHLPLMRPWSLKIISKNKQNLTKPCLGWRSSHA